MRIIVCIKQIRFTYARTGMDPEQYFLTDEDHIYRINPYDEAALELALQVKERQNDVEILLLTIGPITAETELRRCLALGADDIYRIETEDELDPWSKSALLTCAINDLGADLILCGKESMDRQNGQVGAFMAHRLDMPFLFVDRETGLPGPETYAQDGWERTFNHLTNAAACGPSGHGRLLILNGQVYNRR